MIVVYSKPNCQPCKAVKKQLEDSSLLEHFDYKICDITKSEDDYVFVTKVLGAKFVPVVTTSDGEVFFRPDSNQIKKAINDEIDRKDGFEWDGETEDGWYLH